ncbi:hypothetical protein N6L27_03450 [Leisingera sp. SS27]|uniref:hypothetical protein n=1 Tax=Leisingera sp. SS27 TaxID=2979462 RepID=UPI0023310B0F|nr:hypothetical protein [Leisingera sp. SS27]MDC0657046.1 hypothetical protein [Leisingera sp. SS27]
MNDRFRVWFRGNEDACALAEQLWTALQQWDDLHDEPDHGEFSRELLPFLTFGIEYQPFYFEHSHILRPQFLNLYLQWTAANVLDRGDPSDVCKAYVLRAGYYGFLHVITWIIGGDTWAQTCGPEIWRSYGETPKELWEEFNCPDQ